MSDSNTASGESQKAPPTPPKVPWTTPNDNHGQYDLHCHCGAIRFSMKLSPPLYAEETTPEKTERAVAVDCDCSHCQRQGALLVHPFADNVEFTRGLEHRKDYRMASKMNPHWHCDTCGCFLGTDLTALSQMMKMRARYSINIRMLKDFDGKRVLTREAYGMKNINGSYTVGDE